MKERTLFQKIENRLKGVSFAVHLPDGRVWKFGDNGPSFTLKVNDEKVLSAFMQFDELRIAEAYINGDLDVEGDMSAFVSCRESLQDTHPFYYVWRRVLPFLVGQLQTNRRAIKDHYEYDSDFFLSFMDPSRCYSQAIFERDNESLETAQQRKLDFVVQSCGLEAGDRVLDVGGGWGAFVEHAGKQGIRVTALTLAKESETYINDLISRLKLPCNVKFGDFYEYASSRPYDAIVILGVMEHLPDYASVLKQFERLLRPGGKIYLDASSYKRKYAKGAFISRYVFPGNHRYFCLHEFLTQVADTNFEVNSIFNDRHSYSLTCRAWAINLESSSEAIINRWGARLYRIFRLYLWAASYAFSSYSLDAFRVVLQRPEGRENTRS
ncbi:MAG: class I SAM-dependent methyltransferase [Pseudomonadota bacterium]